MRSARWAAVVGGLAVASAACGAGGAGTVAPDRVANLGAAVSSASSARVVVVKTRKVSPYGTILTTSAGRTLYVYTVDPKGASRCNGVCAQEWPPLMVPKGDKVSGVKGLDTVKRSNGSRQVALHHQPLYTFRGDSAAGQVKGQGDDGDWYVETPSGPNKTKPSASKPTASKSSPPAGGGYGY